MGHRLTGSISESKEERPPSSPLSGSLSKPGAAPLSPSASELSDGAPGGGELPSAPIDRTKAALAFFDAKKLMSDLWLINCDITALKGYLHQIGRKRYKGSDKIRDENIIL
eukprot:TRINITY_DN3385_c0_g1_i1.p1 TRINITY_DN3385_c0_g1~~TRINITY_DN3385_c0_g1_i1.p1  ORF type:complete len:111 (+),score=2.86 TRINITY_DN3385_c0_g1_i1:40-372(+)